MIRRPPRSTQSRSSAASDVYKRQHHAADGVFLSHGHSFGTFVGALPCVLPFTTSRGCPCGSSQNLHRRPRSGASLTPADWLRPEGGWLRALPRDAYGPLSPDQRTVACLSTLEMCS